MAARRGVPDGRTGAHRLGATLERLLAIRADTVKAALDQASQLLVEALAADKVDAFLYEPEGDALVALGTSDTPMGRREHEIGLDRLPLAGGGRTVAVFQAGEPYLTEHADRDPGVLAGFVKGLGVRSMLAVPLEVGGERRGVLAADAARPAAFSPADLQFLAAVAHWVGLVAQRAQLAERLAQETVAHARLAEIDRLRSEFIAAVSHDLQTPLTAILVTLGLLEDSASARLVPEERELLASARHSGERLRLRLADLLAAAEMEGGTLRLERTPLDLRDVVARVAGVVRPLVQAKGQTLAVDLPTPLPLEGDARWLEHATLNLLANAHVHTPLGTRIAVAGHATADEVHLVVHDTGPGIPAGDLDRIFRRAYHRGGSGLGLTIVRALVELHGGRVWAENTEGPGATFHVTLPQGEQDDQEGGAG